MDQPTDDTPSPLLSTASLSLVIDYVQTLPPLVIKSIVALFLAIVIQFVLLPQFRKTEDSSAALLSARGGGEGRALDDTWNIDTKRRDKAAEAALGRIQSNSFTVKEEEVTQDSKAVKEAAEGAQEKQVTEKEEKEKDLDEYWNREKRSIAAEAALERIGSTCSTERNEDSSPVEAASDAELSGVDATKNGAAGGGTKPHGGKDDDDVTGKRNEEIISDTSNGTGDESVVASAARSNSNEDLKGSTTAVTDMNESSNPIPEEEGAATAPSSTRNNNRRSTTSSRRRNTSSTTTASSKPPPPPLRTTSVHPGFTSYHIWHDAISSIHRLYTIGSKSQPIEIPPTPKSERGFVPIQLEIMNRTTQPMDVFWVDYLGKEEYRGSASPNGGVWVQNTWIGHPWTFRTTDGIVLFHFVPYRVIANTRTVRTIADDDGGHGHGRSGREREGLHRLTVLEASALHPDDTCQIDDPVFAYPSSRINTFHAALDFALLQMERENSHPRTLLKYLYNIVLHPEQSKYRQIRTSNKTFWNDVWITAGRGILHALGFVEHGAYVEMGPPDGKGVTLSSERIKQIGWAIQRLENWEKELDGTGNDHQVVVEQAEGVDGYGRAGFGRAGGMNTRR